MKSAGRAGFSLVELMIAVAILGILSALAIPTFRSFVLRSKTGEATGNLSALFKSASVYYSAERAEEGPAGKSLAALRTAGCTIDSITAVPTTPKAQKQRFTQVPGFRALGFNIAEYIYFSYGLDTETGTGGCGGKANDATVYTLFAEGDLDGDKTLSRFELTVGSDVDNVLYHARGFYMLNELE